MAGFATALEALFDLVTGGATGIRGASMIGGVRHSDGFRT